jgi:hypothetical protein
MLSFSSWCLNESFLADVKNVADLVKKAKSDAELKTVLTKWSKVRNTPAKIAVQRGHPSLDVAGVYDVSKDEEDKVPVELTIQLPNDSKLADVASELGNRFVTALDHEWQHSAQSRSRGYVPTRSVSKKHQDDKAAYLANSDEIDTYSVEVAKELIAAGVKPTDFNTILKHSETLQLYVRVLGKDAAETKSLVKKAIKNFEIEKEKE